MVNKPMSNINFSSKQRNAKLKVDTVSTCQTGKDEKMIKPHPCQGGLKKWVLSCTDEEM